MIMEVRNDVSNWYERMNGALNYIEDHLLDDIDLKEVAKITWSTVANFQRIFNIITDLPLSEYIRRRKMTMAALELQQSTIKVIDLAMKYGYESPEAFSRAFHHIHHMSPTQAREKGVQLTAFPRISFLLSIKGVIPMNYRIESHDSMYMTGLSYAFSTKNGENLVEIPKVWQKLFQSGEHVSLEKITLSEPVFQHLAPINAVCDFNAQGVAEEISYLIGVLSNNKLDSVNAYKTVEIPAATWAIFKTDFHTVAGTSQAIQQLIHRVYTEWLPTAKVTLIQGFELELYYFDGLNYWSEYWIRVAE